MPNCSLLNDIHKFVQTEQDRSFLMALFYADDRVAAIELFYHRIGTTSAAFQVGVSGWIHTSLALNYAVQDRRLAECPAHGS